MKRLGLRVDVDTLDGLNQGVPALLDLFGEMKVKASFFVALGPDRSGLVVRSVLRKRGAARRLVRLRRVYGLRTGLRGLLLPPRAIGESNPQLLREVEERGHEVGLHGWDHRRWQDFLPLMDWRRIELDYGESMRAYRKILLKDPSFSASPGWIADSRSLAIQDSLGFRFSSDLRGRSPFYPVVFGVPLNTLQVPVTLPTLDELIAVGEERSLLELPLKDLDTYCGHAEVEGVSRVVLFRDFIKRAQELGFSLYRLTEIHREVLKNPQGISRCQIGEGLVPGRAGKVAVQMEEIQMPDIRGTRHDPGGKAREAGPNAALTA